MHHPLIEMIMDDPLYSENPIKDRSLTLKYCDVNKVKVCKRPRRHTVLYFKEPACNRCPTQTVPATFIKR